MKIVITLTAKDSLKDIHDYYKENVSIKIAEQIKSGIIQKLRFLSAHPFAGQEKDSLKELNLGHRRMVEAITRSSIE
ncbi:MAG: hypothetical protein JWO03_3134 [Bacteroidetes bacterium]|nr:hypothetical protein [Bacteroidota bacterium]